MGAENMINGSAEKRRFTTEDLQSADALRAKEKANPVHHRDTEAPRRARECEATTKALPLGFARGDRFLEVQAMKPGELRSACTGEPHRPFLGDGPPPVPTPRAPSLRSRCNNRRKHQARQFCARARPSSLG